MHPIRSSQVLAISLFVLLFATLALVGCDGGGDGSTTMPVSISTTTSNSASVLTDITQVSVPEFPGWVQVQVPDVTGMYCQDAWAELQSHYLSYDQTFSDPSSDQMNWFHVLEQDPAPGDTVSIFSTVHLHLLYPGYLMPDVIGLEEMPAGELIDQNNLTQAHVYQPTSDSAEWGVVIAQEPEPGTLWGNHPPVTLYIGQQPPSPAPNITSTTLATRSNPTTTTTTLSGRRSQ